MLTTALILLLAPAAALGSPYPTNTCVGAKLRAAATQCRAVFRAWSAWESHQDAAVRDAVIADAGEALQDAWVRAEARSSGQGVDCVGTTATNSALQGIVESAAAATAASINAGLNLADSGDRRCGVRRGEREREARRFDHGATIIPGAWATPTSTPAKATTITTMMCAATSRPAGSGSGSRSRSRPPS